jgi:nitrate reductase molybdenum cofactor assembly chaperone NarJ/NarW
MTPWRLLSLLFDYPDGELLACSAALREEALSLPASPARAAILAFLEQREAQGPEAAQREYVETFDFAKRGTLYLSFHAYGDRRERGMAMLQLKHRYRDAGLELSGSALPDHLPAILEFTHLAPEDGVEVLCGFRPALEVVRSALHEEGSAYAHLLDTVCDLLPAPSEAELQDAHRIAAAGPPTETVGLEPFAPPEVMPVPCGGQSPSGIPTLAVHRREGAAVP